MYSDLLVTVCATAGTVVLPGVLACPALGITNFSAKERRRLIAVCGLLYTTENLRIISKWMLSHSEVALEGWFAIIRLFSCDCSL